jgi:hypothetical protein
VAQPQAVGFLVQAISGCPLRAGLSERALHAGVPDHNNVFYASADVFQNRGNLRKPCGHPLRTRCGAQLLSRRITYLDTIAEWLFSTETRTTTSPRSGFSGWIAGLA